MKTRRDGPIRQDRAALLLQRKEQFHHAHRPGPYEADRRFLALRASGFTGPIDQDGYPETDPAILAIFASLDEATTRLLAARTACSTRPGPRCRPSPSATPVQWPARMTPQAAQARIVWGMTAEPNDTGACSDSVDERGVLITAEGRQRARQQLDEANARWTSEERSARARQALENLRGHDDSLRGRAA